MIGLFSVVNISGLNCKSMDLVLPVAWWSFRVQLVFFFFFFFLLRYFDVVIWPPRDLEVSQYVVSV